MKFLDLLFYIIYKVSILCLGFVLVFSIAILASLTSWYFLLLYIPALLYYYGSGTMDYGNKKHAFAKEKRLRR
jgi:hypothetical protein